MKFDEKKKGIWCYKDESKKIGLIKNGPPVAKIIYATAVNEGHALKIIYTSRLY